MRSLALAAFGPIRATRTRTSSQWFDRQMTSVELVRSAALTDMTPYAYAAVTPPGRQVVTAGACPLDHDDMALNRRAQRHELPSDTGASARLSSSFASEDDRYVDDGDRSQRQQHGYEADRRIYQVHPNREG
jgi:hypothetical protein